MADGERIESMVAQLDFNAPPAACIGADLQRWRITVEQDGSLRSAEFVEDGSAAAAPWQGLLAALRAGRT